ncbi:protein of unknown function [Moritella yayanosii]|uniref:Uncharacterized protein n=1 Tax=Moritella yayanosii TaxID=69539 RepID=A0A330M0I5_9GAMM|nr:protein of unknown function [Moritella yayanosii]
MNKLTGKINVPNAGMVYSNISITKLAGKAPVITFESKATNC